MMSSCLSRNDVFPLWVVLVASVSLLQHLSGLRLRQKLSLLRYIRHREASSLLASEDLVARLRGTRPATSLSGGAFPEIPKGEKRGEKRKRRKSRAGFPIVDESPHRRECSTRCQRFHAVPKNFRRMFRATPARHHRTFEERSARRQRSLRGRSSRCQRTLKERPCRC